MFSFVNFLKGLMVSNDVDQTKQIVLTVSPSATTGTTTTLQSQQTANRTLILPDSTDILTANDAAQTLTNKTIDADQNTISNIENDNIKLNAAIDLNKLEIQVTDKALITDNSGFITTSSTTATELSYVHGVTSNIQDQLNTSLLNPMTTLGDMLYEDATPTITRLPGNTTSTKKFLTQIGTGTISSIPNWDIISSSDIPNLDFSKITTGIVSINQGGTGQTTSNDALNALLPSQTGNSGKFLITNGVDASWISQTPTQQIFISTNTITGYYFNISSATVVAGDTYTNNGETFTIIKSGPLQTRIFTSSTGAPQTSGTLTRTSGTGASSIIFSSAVSMSTYTTPSNVKLIKVTIVGGGGAGGGNSTASSTASAGGGGAGGNAVIKYISSPNTTYFYSIGLGGTGNSGASGSDGTLSVFVDSSIALLAGGGHGGAAGSTASTPSFTGTGGSASVLVGNGDINISGSNGDNGVVFTASTGAGGRGGSSGGGWGPETAGPKITLSGNNANNYGAGGSGSLQVSNGGIQTGGNGSDGILLIEEYY